MVCVCLCSLCESASKHTLLCSVVVCVSEEEKEEGGRENGAREKWEGVGGFYIATSR